MAESSIYLADVGSMCQSIGGQKAVPLPACRQTQEHALLSQPAQYAAPAQSAASPHCPSGLFQPAPGSALHLLAAEQPAEHICSMTILENTGTRSLQFLVAIRHRVECHGKPSGMPYPVYKNVKQCLAFESSVSLSI